MNGKSGPFAFLSLILLLAGACSEVPATEEAAAQPDLAALLPGTWEAVSVQVNVYSADSIPDSSYIFRVNDGDWEALFDVPPPRTYFETDNKYRVEYRDRLDSIMSMSRGIWNVMGDTLMMIEPEETFQYKVKYDKGLLRMIGIRDWDQDGVVDDAYQEVKRKVSISTQ